MRRHRVRKFKVTVGAGGGSEFSTFEVEDDATQEEIDEEATTLVWELIDFACDEITNMTTNTEALDAQRIHETKE